MPSIRYRSGTTQAGVARRCKRQWFLLQLIADNITEARHSNVDGGAVMIAESGQWGTESLVHSQAGQGM